MYENCAKKNVLEFYFVRNADLNSNIEQFAAIIFSSVIETNYSKIENNGQLGDISTLTNFSKGLLNSESRYYANYEIKYFFIDFFGGEMINILCKEAMVIFW